MSFFKSLKSKLLGSIKDDLNSALGGKRASFNSKISGALDDLIAMKTGINISNVPEGISEEALMSATDREEAEKAISDLGEAKGRNTPSLHTTLKFPSDNLRFVDNWIIFRTVKKPHTRSTGQATDSMGMAAGVAGHGVTDYWKGQDGFDQETAGEGNQAYAMTNEYTVALYFPNNVKDAINVEYDQKELGLSDILMDDFLGREWGSLFGSLDDALFESFAKAKQAMVSYAAYDAGVVMDNPKFNTYQGVSFRDHSYTFNLNPYNKADALAIRDIIHTFKMMMLPMSSAENPRTMIMPAEWTIDFMGPILGHIEHPQNCFLKSCDVDYAGGKDMSFIEEFSASKPAVAPEEDADGNVIEGTGKDRTSPQLQHYPNGITLSLVFQEILNLDRLRYVGRVSANAMGAKQVVGEELDNFEKNLKKDVMKHQATEEGVLGDRGFPAEFNGLIGPELAVQTKAEWDKLTPGEKNFAFQELGYSFRYRNAQGEAYTSEKYTYGTFGIKGKQGWMEFLNWGNRNAQGERVTDDGN